MRDSLGEWSGAVTAAASPARHLRRYLDTPSHAPNNEAWTGSFTPQYLDKYHVPHEKLLGFGHGAAPRAQIRRVFCVEHGA